MLTWLGLMVFGWGHALAGPYAFVEGHVGPLESLENRFPTPEGFDRVDLPSLGFGAWLRALPVDGGAPVVRTSTGRVIPAPALATVPLDLGRGDLQQCADSALRLYAEYRWDTGRTEDMAFHFTSGDRSAWTDWVEGERFVVSGPRVQRTSRVPVEPTHAAYRSWLQHTFRYAGTRSLHHDTRPVEPSSPLRPGDVFVDPGSPGHAVVLLDVAESATGERIALIGQGFMPAQTFHVLKPELGHGHAGWFSLPSAASGVVKTPSWRAFSRADALRFPK